MKSGISLLAIVSRALAPMTLDDAAAHREDLIRTRIEPGADPRAMWSGSLMTTDPTIYRDEPHTPKWCEVGPLDRPDLAWINGAWNALGWRLSSRARYVPVDVLRWRDPEHRAELARRARAYATDRVTYAWPAQSTAAAGQRVNAQSTSELEREG